MRSHFSGGQSTSFLASSLETRCVGSMAVAMSTEGVIICISKANDDRAKSLLYVCEIEDNHIGEGNPAHLINPRSGMKLWGNNDLRREKLSFGEIVTCRIIDNKYVYDGKTGKNKMVSNDELHCWSQLFKRWITLSTG